jgi:nitric oxide reductase NorD protein
MEWDEKLFAWSLRVIGSIRHGRRQPSLEELNQAVLSEVSPRLKIIASAFAGQTIEIKEAETIGGLRNAILLLPASMTVAPTVEQNTGAYIYRVIYSIVARDLGLELPEALSENKEAQILFSTLAAGFITSEVKVRFPALASIADELAALELARRQSRATEHDDRSAYLETLMNAALRSDSSPTLPSTSADVQKTFAESWPRFQKLEGRAPLVFPMFWSLLYPMKSGVMREAHQASNIPVRQASLSTGTEKKAKARESIKEIKFNENREGENPIVHAFEKLRTAADYTGGRKSLDGSDELEEHLEALSELDMRNVIRTHERTDSIFKADVMMDVNVADLEDDTEAPATQFTYDEWDESHRTYKKDWCKIYVSPAIERVPIDQAFTYIHDALQKNQRQVRELRLMFEKIQAERRWRNRQIDGPEIDLDAVVDRYATVRSGHTPKEKLYLARRRYEKDFATLILLDSSLSTDSWIENRRVMDVLKESMLVLGEVIARDKVAIGGFYSNTRNDCHYVEVKRYTDPWSAARYRLTSLKPTGYTRIGPALRHATHLLKETPAKKKLLLLISDGKPTDYDRYEGRYGIGDIRQAIREASSAQIMTRALAIDVNAKLYLPQMFGPGNFQILPHPGQLASKLAEIYSWLMV